MMQSLAGIQLFKEFSYENILEAFLAGSSDGFLILDKNLRVVLFNEKFYDFHTRQYGTVIKNGSVLTDLLPLPRLAELNEKLERVLTGEIVKYNKKYSLAKDKSYWYDFEFHPLKNKAGDIIGVGVGAFETTEKHEAQEKLRQSEDLFKTLIQNSTDAFQLCNDQFELLFTSATIENILGLNADDLVGQNGLTMVHPDEREVVANWFEKLKTRFQTVSSIEYRMRNKEGKWIWVENYASNLLQNPNVQAIVMNLRNIQAKKIADFALILAEQRLSLLLNNTEESFIILNSRLRVVAYNKAAQQHSLYFYCRELQSGISVLDLVAAEDIEELINLYEKVFEGEQMDKETVYVDEKGLKHIYSHIYRPLFDEHQEISGVFITSSDITERKLAEQQVKESEERFKTIIQESFDAVLITDEAANITYSSPSITNVLGYTAEELTGNTAFHYMLPEDVQAAIAKFAEVMLNPNSERNIDVKMCNGQGNFVWIELKAKNMFHNKYVQGILVSLRDITSRKKAEEIISLSEQRFKGLVQSGADMIWILNEQSELQYASPTVKSILGIEPKKRYGLNVFNYVHPDDLANITNLFSNFIHSGNKQTLIGPYRYLTDNGQYFWLEATVTNLIADPSIRGIVINSRDVTDRRKLTDELAANTERLKTSQRLAKLSYVEYDFATQTFFYSDLFHEILGLPPTVEPEFNFDFIDRIIHPDDLHRIKQQIASALEDFKDFNAEYRIVTGNGTEKVISTIGGIVKSNDGNAESFRVTMQDITDSKMAMLALQTMESRFKSLFDNNIDGIIMSIESGEILSANPAICKLLGYSDTQLKALSISDIFDVNSLAIRNMESQRLEHGSYIGEVMIRNKSGRYIYTEVTTLTIDDVNGKNVISTIIRDITDKKKTEEEQKALTEELLRNNQDLQQFSFITSHNLRAPVANLISLLSLYNREDATDDFNPVLIEKFEEATLQLNSTLNDLLNVLVIKSNNNSEKQTIRLNDVFKSVRSNVDNLLQEQGGSLSADFSEVEELNYNRIHIDSIFLNLISNAIRYRSSERKPEITVRSYRQDNWVIISFADNGQGIDLKRYGDRLFGLYQRFHVSKEGKGLGLYMTKSQIMAMGGKIEVESEPGKGTTFKVYFKS